MVEPHDHSRKAWSRQDGGAGPGPILVAATIALVVGLLRPLAGVIRKALFAVPLEADTNIVWMAPLANLLLFVPLGALLAVGGRAWRPLGAPRVALTILLTAGAFAVLLNVPGIHHWALLLLAVGIGIRAAIAIARRPAAARRVMRRIVISVAPVLAVVALGLAAWPGLRERWLISRGPAPAGAVPNVLLIVLDTVRSLSLSLYGYERPTTPHLEEWAKTGVLFTRASATSSWTLPSIAGMFTGRYPHELSAGFVTPLDDEHPVLAETLAGHGYATAGFVANRKYASYEHGLDRGFARYDDFGVNPGQLAVSAALGALIAWQPRVQTYFGNDLYGRRDAGELIDELLDWLPEEGERPFFAFLNLYDAHHPYLAPSPWDRMFTRDTTAYSPAILWQGLPAPLIAREREAYEGAIAYLDAEVDRLLRALRDRGQLDNTIVIVTSDHGEQFGEHGLVDHGNSLYRPLLDVPLLVLWPGGVPAGTAVTQPVSLRDLPATILDLAGLPNRVHPGTSLARTWRGNGDAGEEPILAELTWPNGEIAFSVRSDGSHYIDWFGNEQVYDLTADPDELRDVAAATTAAEMARFRAQRLRLTGRVERPPEASRWARLLLDLQRR